MPDPAEIQQQIEVTRAELATTIDAIADRVSPKRVASRGVESFKSKIEDFRSRGTALPSGGGAPALNGSSVGGQQPGQQPLPARVVAQLKEAKETRGKSVRWDRVAEVAVAVTVIVLVIRRRHR